MESVIMSEFEFVKEIPRVWRDHEKYAEAAKANPGEFLKLPWPDDRFGSLCTHYRKHYGLEAHYRTVDGERRVYVRANG